MKVLRFFSYFLLLLTIVFLLLWSSAVLQKVAKSDLSLFEQFNIFEFFLWQFFAVVSAWYAVRKSRVLAMALAFAFMFFGISDLVENQTGAWWTPWWMLLWKGTCLLSLVYLIWRLFGNELKRKKSETEM